MDGDKNAQPIDSTTKKFHKVAVNKTETINDDMGSKYRSSTLVPIDIVTTINADNVTTEIPITTPSVDTPSTTSTPNVKTTTNAVPIDDHTTTETAQTSTSKSSNVAPEHQTRYMRWVLGMFSIIFFTFFIWTFILSEKIY